MGHKFPKRKSPNARISSNSSNVSVGSPTSVPSPPPTPQNYPFVYDRQLGSGRPLGSGSYDGPSPFTSYGPPNGYYDLTGYYNAYGYSNAYGYYAPQGPALGNGQSLGLANVAVLPGPFEQPPGTPPPDQVTPIPSPLRRTGGWDNKRTLYHATSRESARSIHKSCVFRPGTYGMYGAGIYFAVSAADAQRKARHGTDIVITVEVFLGFMLEVPQPMHELTQQHLNDYGCHSIRGTAGMGDEYVIFDSEQVIWFCEFDGL
jgi:hypothetical protein